MLIIFHPSDDIRRVVAIARSHERLSLKNKLVLCMLSKLETLPHDGFVNILRQLAVFPGRSYAGVSHEASKRLIMLRLPSLLERRGEIEAALKAVRDDDPEGGSIISLIDRTDDIIPPLLTVLEADDDDIRSAALQIYLRRVYRPFDVIAVKAMDPVDRVHTGVSLEFRGAKSGESFSCEWWECAVGM